VKRIANSDNARRWLHLVRGPMWTIIAENIDEAIDLLFSLAAQEAT